MRETEKLRSLKTKEDSVVDELGIEMELHEGNINIAEIYDVYK